MTRNTSATGGYLIPVGPQPSEDLDLDDIIQGVIAGITGFDPTLVRPKWQERPGPQPDRSVDWCAFAVNVTGADVNPTLVHNGLDDCGNGTTTQSRTENLEVIASFYGPAGRGYAAGLRDGFGITQNRDALRAQNIAYVSTDRLTLVPDLTNSQFIRRVDLVFRLRRMTNRVYAIRNVESAQGEIVTSQGSVSGF